MKDLKEKIRDLSEEVMDILGPDYKEAVYEKALAHELRLNGIPYERQTNIEIRYKGYYLKDVLSDIIVEDSLLLELKAVKSIRKRHVKQAQVYMFSLDVDEGMVVSFSGDGEVLIEDVSKPELNKPEGFVVEPREEKGVEGIEPVLKESADGIMERFGTEFMFTDAKFDMYVSALAVDLILNGINFRKAESPIIYKNLEVDRKELEFVLDDNTGIYPFSYKKKEDIEEEEQEVQHLIGAMNLDCIRMVGFPEKEEVDTCVLTIEKEKEDE